MPSLLTTRPADRAPVGRTRPSRWDQVPVAVVVVSVFAWALAIDTESGRHGHHGGHNHLPAGGVGPAVEILRFVASWQVMIAAMMLPGSLAMLRVFGRLARSQPRPALVQATFLAGYITVWTGFGLAAFGLDALLHQAIGASTWLTGHRWLLAGAVLAGAGAFQFSALKDRCLTECRTPVGFLVERYRPGISSAFRVGSAHGVFCVGCCWALMLVAFAVGAGNLIWMALLTTVMAVERTVSWGPRIARPLGVVLIALGLLVMVHPAGLPAVFGPS